MQEESSFRIERETIRIRAMAEAEGRAHEAKFAEDVNKRMLIERANAEREKWVSTINTTFEHIGGGLRAILTDQNKLVVAVGVVIALAAGICTARIPFFMNQPRMGVRTRERYESAEYIPPRLLAGHWLQWRCIVVR
ncbi:hypothetical protein M8C21_020778 [Ambrosia artemisiifolia]|uniref:ATPase family AAA domain-containing protein n=1 Tax=Ambrosia artemisiifolia TaxID=4212 RepID=A0AAD5GIM9_AMBAR|nr:hypothetical protein M8C21_020778 [Ambrosia artemisiifolia]